MFVFQPPWAAWSRGMDWLRWYHGSCTDPKFRVVAKKAARDVDGIRVSDVLAVWAMVLERASASEPRGTFAGFDSEGADAALDLPEGAAAAILRALAAKELTKGDKVVNFDKRQPKRERDDNSTDRVRACRERKKQENNTSCGNVTPCNATQRQETPRLDKSREELITGCTPLPPEGGEGQTLFPPSPEDDPDLTPDAEISSLNDCTIEFQDLAAVYQQAGGCVDVVPAYKAYQAMRLKFPLRQIELDLEKRRYCDQWQRGRIPKLSNYIQNRVWLNSIQPARASPARDPTMPRNYRECQDAERRAEAERLRTGRQHGQPVVANNPGRIEQDERAALS
jgi:hypothetical protein